MTDMVAVGFNPRKTDPTDHQTHETHPIDPQNINRSKN